MQDLCNCCAATLFASREVDEPAETPMKLDCALDGGLAPIGMLSTHIDSA